MGSIHMPLLSIPYLTELYAASMASPSMTKFNPEGHDSVLFNHSCRHSPFSLCLLIAYVRLSSVTLILYIPLFHTMYKFTLISVFIMQVEICIFVFDIMFTNGEQ